MRPPGGPSGPAVATAQLGGQMAGMSLGPPVKPAMGPPSVVGGPPGPMMGQPQRPAAAPGPLPARPAAPVNGLSAPQSNGFHPPGRLSPMPAVNGGGGPMPMPPNSAPSPMPPQQQPMQMPLGPGQPQMPLRPMGMQPDMSAPQSAPGMYSARGPAPPGANPPAAVGGPMFGGPMQRPGMPPMPGGPSMPGVGGPLPSGFGAGAPVMSQPSGMQPPPLMGSGGMPPMGGTMQQPQAGPGGYPPMGGMPQQQAQGGPPGGYPQMGGMPQPAYQQPGGMGPGYGGMAAPQRKSLDPDSMPNPIQVYPGWLLPRSATLLIFVEYDYCFVPFHFSNLFSFG